MPHFATYFTALTQQMEEKLRRAVLDMGEEMLLSPPDDVVADLVDEYTLRVPDLHPEAMTVQHDEVTLRDEGFAKVRRFRFHIPFDGQPGLFDFHGSSVPVARFAGAVEGGELILTVLSRGNTADQVAADRDRQLRLYEEALGPLRRDIGHYNVTLGERAKRLVESRRQRLLDDRHLVESLGVPLRRKEDALIPVQVRRRITVTRPQQPSGERYAPEPRLEDAAYESIIAAARSLGIAMERAPGTFSQLSEEGLRDHFLAMLNMTFEGDATGEVFNGEGKTDILLRWGERNIFVSELKVWSTEVKFRDTIDQLLRNLVWRDGRAAIFLFTRNRDVSNVVDKAHAILEAHPAHKRTVDATSELERRYVFHWPGDVRREIKLTLLVFPVPEAEGKRSRRRTAAATTVHGG